MKPTDLSLGNLFRAARAAPETPGLPDADRLARRVADCWVAEGAAQVEALLWVHLGRHFTRGLATALVVVSVLAWVTWVPVPEVALAEPEAELAGELLALLPLP
jgi:hypothetical protein